MNKVVPLYRSQMRALHRLQLEEPTAHMVLHAILRLMGSHTALVASHAGLADILGCGKSLVSACVQELRQRGFIETLRVGGVHAFIVHRRGEEKRASESVLVDAMVLATRDDRCRMTESRAAVQEVPRMLITPERGKVVQDCASLRGEQLALNLE
ncbi:MAG: hypothetical protein ACP5P4_11335 [Steroidobacteraceae bacterium]